IRPLYPFGQTYRNSGYGELPAFIGPSTNIGVVIKLLGPGKRHIEPHGLFAAQPRFRKVKAIHPIGPTGLQAQGKSLPIPHRTQLIALPFKYILDIDITEGKSQLTDNATPPVTSLQLDLARSRFYQAIAYIHGSC